MVIVVRGVGECLCLPSIPDDVEYLDPSVNVRILRNPSFVIDFTVPNLTFDPKCEILVCIGLSFLSFILFRWAAIFDCLTTLSH